MPQYGRPSADTTAGSWTTTPLWSKIDDDLSASPTGDGVTITSDAVGNAANTTTAQFALTTLVDPLSSSGHIIRVRWLRDGAASRTLSGTVLLREGTTTIATLSVSPDVGTTEIESTHTLSAGEADSITNYGNLNFQVFGTGTAGGPARSLIVESLELELPVAPVTAAGGVVCAGIAEVWTASEGPNSGGTFANAGTGTDWTNPSFAANSDNFHASSGNMTSGTSTKYLRCTNFGFGIDSGATIRGIRVDVEQRALSGSIADFAISMVKAGTEVGDLFAYPESWTASDKYITYGGSNDLWGTTWTPAEIDSTGFGFSISAQSFATFSNAGIDHVRITVYYTAAGASTYNETAAGGVLAAGSATAQATYNTTAAGGTLAAGSATVQATYNSTAAGGAVVAGIALDQHTATNTASGGVVLAGAAIPMATYAITAAGGAVVAGTTDVDFTDQIAASGGVVVAGAAIDELVGGSNTYNETAAGGVVVAGAAIPMATYAITAAGGTVVAGSATAQATYSATSTGGAVVAGAAIDEHVGGNNTYNETAAGGALVAGSASVTGSVNDTAAGGAVVAGAASHTTNQSEAAAGGVVLAGVSSFQRIYGPPASGGVVIGGPAIHAIIFNPSTAGGVVVAGAASDSVRAANVDTYPLTVYLNRSPAITSYVMQADAHTTYLKRNPLFTAYIEQLEALTAHIEQQRSITVER